jgi:hypothetical protein
MTCANDSNDLASIGEANRQHTAANLAKAIKPLLGFAVSKITCDNTMRVYKSHLCVLKRDLMLAVIFGRLFGYPIRISPQSSRILTKSHMNNHTFLWFMCRRQRLAVKHGTCTSTILGL